MISKKIEDAVNKQINREYYSSYLYLSMAAWAEHAGFKGAADWLKVQAQEEMGHVMKFYGYVNDQLGLVKLGALAEPPAKFKSLLDVFEKTLEHERLITKAINDLAALAASEKDYATGVLLQWFISEQVEEEAAASDLVTKLKMIGASTGGLFMMDHHLGKRKAG